ncbi:MAG: hypothetical protein IJN07_03050 [Clostridia bacterium]|nr:hypothetical protein [Clostridia bacterium]
MKAAGLSQNQLKIIAVISMTIDHIGYILFPKLLILRIIGRIAFPIFAYSLYEGAKYTRRPIAYLLRTGGLGLVCLLAYYWYDRRLYGNVLITFFLSLCMLLSLRFLKENFREKNRRKTVLFALLFVGSVALTVLTCHLMRVDYGLVGCLLPLFAALCDWQTDNSRWQGYPLIGFSLGLLLLSADQGSIQYYSLLSLPLLMLSSHRRGTAKMKYFFYIYYPMHLLVLEGLKVGIQWLR